MLHQEDHKEAIARPIWSHWELQIRDTVHQPRQTWPIRQKLCVYPSARRPHSQQKNPPTGSTGSKLCELNCQAAHAAARAQAELHLDFMFFVMWRLIARDSRPQLRLPRKKRPSSPHITTESPFSNQGCQEAKKGRAASKRAAKKALKT